MFLYERKMKLRLREKFLFPLTLQQAKTKTLEILI